MSRQDDLDTLAASFPNDTPTQLRARYARMKAGAKWARENPQAEALGQAVMAGLGAVILGPIVLYLICRFAWVAMFGTGY